MKAKLVGHASRPRTVRRELRGAESLPKKTVCDPQKHRGGDDDVRRGCDRWCRLLHVGIVPR